MSATSTQPSITRTILRNTLVVTSGGGLIRVLGFAYTIFVVRQMGDHTYGQYATVLAFVGLFSILFELGTTQYVERSIAQDRSRLGELFWNLVVVRLSLSVLGVFVLTGVAMAIGYERLLVLCVMVYTTTFIGAALLSALLVVFTSHERYDLWTGGQMLGQLGSMACGALALWLGGGLLAFLCAGLVVIPLQIIYCVWVIRKFNVGSLGFQFDRHRLPDFIRASLPFSLTSLALTVSFNIDTFILGLFQPSNVVGWYSAAYRLVPTIVSLLGGFLTVLVPSLARSYVSDPEGVRVWTRNSLQWLSMFALPIAMGVSLLAPHIVTSLYGSAYAPSGMVLALICWDIPLRLFNAFAGNVTSAVGLERRAWRIFMAGSSLGVVLYLIAIPTFGMMGAAAVTVLTDGLTSALFFWLLNKHMQIGQIGSILARVALGAVLMGGVVWLVNQHAPLALSVLSGMLSFGVLVLVLQIVDRVTLASVAARVSRRVLRRPA